MRQCAPAAIKIEPFTKTLAATSHCRRVGRRKAPSRQFVAALKVRSPSTTCCGNSSRRRARALDVVDVERVRFEQEPNNGQILGNTFRLIHTIKGTCGFLGLPAQAKG